MFRPITVIAVLGEFLGGIGDLDVECNDAARNSLSRGLIRLEMFSRLLSSLEAPLGARYKYKRR